MISEEEQRKLQQEYETELSLKLFHGDKDALKMLGIKHEPKVIKLKEFKELIDDNVELEMTIDEAFKDALDVVKLMKMKLDDEIDLNKLLSNYKIDKKEVQN